MGVFAKAAAAAACLWSATAAAQTGLALNVGGRQQQTMTKNDCAVSLQVNWALTSVTGTACTDLSFWTTAQPTCGTAPVAGDQVLASVLQVTWMAQLSSSVSLPVNGLPIFLGSSATPCPALDVEQTARVCAFAKFVTFGLCGTGEIELKGSTAPTVTYDAKAPAAPTINSVVGIDGALQLTFTAPSDAATVSVQFREVGAIGFSQGPTVSPTASSLFLSGLTNGLTYEVQLLAEDDAANQSLPSATALGTPVASFGFYAAYQNAGGGEPTGCSAGNAFVWPLMAMAWAPAWFRRRRGERR